MDKSGESAELNESHMYSSLSVVQDDDDDSGQLMPFYRPHPPESASSGSFFSRIKQSFNGSNLGTLLGQHGTMPARVNHRKQPSNCTTDFRSNNLLQTPPDSPTSSSCLPHAVGNVFSPMPAHSTCSTPCSRSHAAASVQSDASCTVSLSTSFSTGCFSPQHALITSASTSERDPENKWSPTLTSSSGAQSTPPLTPDVFNDAQSPESAYSQTDPRMSSSLIMPKSGAAPPGPEAKKGKDPAPPFSYDALLADMTGEVTLKTAGMQGVAGNDDLGEWWGLEYTLELSRGGSRTSDSSASTTGEHSKSRKSWAAIHQGTVPLHYEDAGFFEWQLWHRNLEKTELRRRRKRTIDFIEESDRLAHVYVDEMYARRALLVHEDVLTEDETYDAQVWLEYAVERRPDPYYPPEDHNLGWVVKNHRSLACLNELKELSTKD
ncbi:hypothetical protein M0805_007083 [Coniferiporia weirii]|nr:hypothetical protein M0805_007083 [Coniferiporia weirii]